jgi:hypothetical protein
MKVVNLLLAAMFLVFAFLQLNDPDPVIWILIYGAMAVISVLIAFRYYPKLVMVALLLIYLAYSFVFIPGVREWLDTDDKSELFDNVAKMEHLYIEESREFIGLWICIVVLLVQLVWYRKASKK